MSGSRINFLVFLVYKKCNQLSALRVHCIADGDCKIIYLMDYRYINWIAFICVQFQKKKSIIFSSRIYVSVFKLYFIFLRYDFFAYLKLIFFMEHILLSRFSKNNIVIKNNYCRGVKVFNI